MYHSALSLILCITYLSLILVIGYDQLTLLLLYTIFWYVYSFVFQFPFIIYTFSFLNIFRITQMSIICVKFMYIVIEYILIHHALCTSSFSFSNSSCIFPTFSQIQDLFLNCLYI